MLRRTLLTLALVLVMATPAAAEKVGMYLGAKFIDAYQSHWGGGLLDGSESHNTVGFGIFAGYDFYATSEIPIRAEIEYALRTNWQANDSGHLYGNYYSLDASINVQTIMANVYYDFYNESDFTPYIGAGLGMGIVNSSFEVDTHVRSVSRDSINTVFAWNIGAGIAYAINENVSADLGYRYLNLGYSETEMLGETLSTTSSAHEVSLGLRVGF